MSEQALAWVAIGKLLWVVGFAALYSFAGMKGKWKRRIVAPFYLTGGLIGFSLLEHCFSWLFLLFPILLYASLSLGYGADRTSAKIKRRFIYGLCVGFASVPVAIGTGNYFLFALHVFVCCLFSVLLGVWNPTSARQEETLIGATAGCLPLFFF